jgi:hypothetical protein
VIFSAEINWVRIGTVGGAIFVSENENVLLERGIILNELSYCQFVKTGLCCIVLVRFASELRYTSCVSSATQT